MLRYLQGDKCSSETKGTLRIHIVVQQSGGFIRSFCALSNIVNIKHIINNSQSTELFLILCLYS